jgi:putative thioredoxin
MGNSKFGSLPKGFGRAIDLSSLARPAHQGPTSGSSGNSSNNLQGASGSVAIEVTENNLVTDFIEYSATVPSFIFIWSDRAKGSREMLDTLDRLARQDNGAWRLGAICFDTQPELAQALRITAIPAAVALIQQQVLPIPTLPPEEASLRLMINRILEVAEQQGLTISRSGAVAPEGTPVEEVKQDPEEEEAYAAIERGDFASAADAYKRLLARKPNDQMAQQALAQCELMVRTGSIDPKRAIEDADKDPKNLDFVIRASDAEVAMGSLEAAFARLITFIKAHPGDERKRAKEHLLTLFSLFPPDDPVLIKARRDLASALF